jgi:hypothetical protein
MNVYKPSKHPRYPQVKDEILLNIICYRTIYPGLYYMLEKGEARLVWDNGMITGVERIREPKVIAVLRRTDGR